MGAPMAKTRKLLGIEGKYGMWQVKRPLRATQHYFGTETKPYRYFDKRSYTEALELQAEEAVIDKHGTTVSW
jgi:hypothetical protein